MIFNIPKSKQGNRPEPTNTTQRHVQLLCCLQKLKSPQNGLKLKNVNHTFLTFKTKPLDSQTLQQNLAHAIGKTLIWTAVVGECLAWVGLFPCLEQSCPISSDTIISVRRTATIRALDPDPHMTSKPLLPGHKTPKKMHGIRSQVWRLSDLDHGAHGEWVMVVSVHEFTLPSRQLSNFEI